MNIEAVFFCNYSIGTDTWKEVPFVCGLYGKRILLIGGKKALRAGNLFPSCQLSTTAFISLGR